MFFIDYPENVTVSVQSRNDLSSTYLLSHDSVRSDSISPVWKHNAGGSEYQLKRMNGMWNIFVQPADTDVIDVKKNIFAFTPMADIWQGSDPQVEGKNSPKPYNSLFSGLMKYS